MYADSYKMLMKGKKKTTWRSIPCSWIRRLNIVHLPKLMLRFDIISIKIPARVFVDVDKITLKCIWEGKESAIAKTILKRKIKEGLLIH